MTRPFAARPPKKVAQGERKLGDALLPSAAACAFL